MTKTKTKKSITTSTRTNRQSHEPRVSKQTVELTTSTSGKFGTKKALRPKVAVLLDTDDIVKEQVGGFVDFLRDNSVIALAIGFVAGSQGQAVVKSLITSFIDPAFKLFFGEALSAAKFHQSFGSRGVDFGWGAFAYALLNVIFVLATIYILIKVFKLDRLVKPKESKDAKDKSAAKKSGKKKQKQ